MSDQFLSTRPPMGFAARILAAFGYSAADKASLCTSDRMAALDDPATRKALADLPQHLLRDIGVIGHALPDGPAEDPSGGEALRRHLW